mmetsp:Transcript_19524/g.32119  ORF Transcript_19524/g.32119 Transcript_19524/m.32119 type:complete len:424 (-) Transcript_19524:470-1741(-)|eukprot:CAMPEP_0203783844 /NCGR_PEP_ID=MMETSP0100_2-20121128/139_1 /ASSEMBLY_ACC=CAM_ASM_000210 /TAXON_ID=96639 /ORGANISM=" , Strain NY0313808BC1" /LENGTH=423 /DNA_ID=CAMNT_0050685765 /DNA_START=182 /DNA_END=1453 /DNA_ORIENTATION=-
MAGFVGVEACGESLGGDDLSILSYNVLLPNSVDGWWIYKYYGGNVDRSMTTWDSRCKLLEKQIIGIDADVVCLQEVSAESFEDDFLFMKDAGYAYELLNKGRMRNATFWKKDRVTLKHSFCKDRSLTTRLALENGKEIFVVNVHLTAGNNAPRRLRQVHDAVEGIRKQTKGEEAKYPVVICGDFNSQGNTAVRKLLETGMVEPEYRESGDPTEKDQESTQVTSKKKRCQLGRFSDAYAEAFARHDAPPPTLVCKCLADHMVDSQGKMISTFETRMHDMFLKLSSDGALMSQSDIDNWLISVNGELGRGSEFRAVDAILDKKEEPAISFQDFISVYQNELDQGKFWGVEHDLVCITGCGVAIKNEAPFTARFDHIYYTPDLMKCKCVSHPVPEDKTKQLFEEGDTLPNLWHPSDHLPIAASFIV